MYLAHYELEVVAGLPFYLRCFSLPIQLHCSHWTATAMQNISQLKGSCLICSGTRQHIAKYFRDYGIFLTKLDEDLFLCFLDFLLFFSFFFLDEYFSLLLEVCFPIFSVNLP